MKLTRLGQLSERLLDDDPNTTKAEAGIAIMVAEVALQVAHAQLVKLGGDGYGGDKIQKAVLDQIDVALERR
jgi:hypothetical protein